MNKVSFKEYSFESICEVELIPRDNPNMNLVYAKLHEKDVMARLAASGSSIGRDISDPENLRPVLQPLNFTSDWINQNKKKGPEASSSPWDALDISDDAPGDGDNDDKELSEGELSEGEESDSPVIKKKDLEDNPVHLKKSQESEEQHEAEPLDATENSNIKEPVENSHLSKSWWL